MICYMPIANVITDLPSSHGKCKITTLAGYHHHFGYKQKYNAANTRLSRLQRLCLTWYALVLLRSKRPWQRCAIDRSKWEERWSGWISGEEREREGRMGRERVGGRGHHARGYARGLRFSASYHLSSSSSSVWLLRRSSMDVDDR